jgi:hypothetical protein
VSTVIVIRSATLLNLLRRERVFNFHCERSHR